MARIERVNLSQEFNKLHSESIMVGETNDCGVKAVALVCDVSYEVAHEALRKFGRRNRAGTPFNAIREAVKSLGFELKEWNFMDLRAVIETYPGVHVNLHQITTHHPRRFPKAWAPLRDKRLLLYTKRHVAAFRHGEVIDWTVNKAKRVWTIWEVTKI